MCCQGLGTMLRLESLPRCASFTAWTMSTKTPGRILQVTWQETSCPVQARLQSPAQHFGKRTTSSMTWVIVPACLPSWFTVVALWRGHKSRYPNFPIPPRENPHSGPKPIGLMTYKILLSPLRPCIQGRRGRGMRGLEVRSLKFEV